MEFGEAFNAVQAQPKPRFGETYFVVRINKGYYRSRLLPTTIKPHEATMFRERELAQKIAARHGGVVVEEVGWQPNYVEWEDTGEPDGVQNLESAVRIAVADGLDPRAIRKIVNQVLKAEKPAEKENHV